MSFALPSIFSSALDLLQGFAREESPPIEWARLMREVREWRENIESLGEPSVLHEWALRVGSLTPEQRAEEIRSLREDQAWFRGIPRRLAALRSAPGGKLHGVDFVAWTNLVLGWEKNMRAALALVELTLAVAGETAGISEQALERANEIRLRATRAIAWGEHIWAQLTPEERSCFERDEGAEATPEDLERWASTGELPWGASSS